MRSEIFELDWSYVSSHGVQEPLDQLGWVEVGFVHDFDEYDVVLLYVWDFIQELLVFFSFEKTEGDVVQGFDQNIGVQCG